MTRRRALIEVYVGFLVIIITSMITNIFLLSSMMLSAFSILCIVKMPIRLWIHKMKLVMLFGGGLFFIPLILVSGYHKSSIIFLRFIICIVTCIYIEYRVGMTHVLTALYVLKVPMMLINVMAFNIRYIRVLQDEMKRMVRAKASRGYGKRRLMNRQDIRHIASLVSVLCVRAYRRSERIHQAMEARGYSGEGVMEYANYTSR